MGKKFNVTQDGRTYVIDEAQLQGALDQGFQIESEAGKAARARAQVDEDTYGGVLGTVAAGIAAPIRGGTLGLGDAYLATQGDSLRDFVAGAKEANPTLSTVLEIGGAIAPTLLTGGAATPAGLASRAGTAIAKRGGGGVVRAIAGGAVEGALQGAGTGVSELALSADPLTLEHAVSTISSNALFGGVVGGAAGGLGKVAEKGLLRAKGSIDDYLARQTKAAAVPEHLAQLDDVALDAREAAHRVELKAARTTEQAAIVDDLRAFRNELAESKPYLAAQEGADREVREIGAMTAKADARIRTMLNNPKDIAAKPGSIMSALQQQEFALESLAAKADDIRLMVEAEQVAGGTSTIGTTRLKALEAVAPALERNRAIQARVKGVLEDFASPELEGIAAARTARKAAEAAEKEAKNSIGAQLLGGTVFGTVASAASALPVIGALAGPVLGAKASKAAVNLVFGKLGNAAQAAAKRTGQAVDAFLAAAPTAQKVAPVLATKVLGAVRYAPSKDEPKEGTKLPDLYKARAAELRSQVALDETGTPRMRPEARAEVAKMLGGVRMTDPRMADQMETIAARRIEFLASKLPKRPDLPGMDKWQPSELAIREFARYAAAVEDPGGVEERLASGSITPEDTEAYKAVYPERFAAMQAALMERMPELRGSLPYKRRLALSIFSGVPIDPAMTPNVLAVLQGSFAAEEGSEGGTQAPTPKPAFGSVSRPQGTPSQERAT